MNKTEEKEQNRSRMIEAAIVEFDLHGYEGASTNHICAGASISKGLLYHYFKSKENLFAEALGRCMEDFERAHWQGLSGCRQMAGLERLTAVLTQHLAFFSENPYHYRLIGQLAFEAALYGGEMYKKCRAGASHLGLGALEEFLKSIPLKSHVSREKAVEALFMLSSSIQRKYIFAIQAGQLKLPDAQRRFAGELKEILGLVCQGIAL